jgi:uncharacterized membrane protein (DUF106 family)|tara:strand:- start:28 stop:204 length:177 start_codon:yes stop_codon:yes gene_type:complete
MLGIIVLGVLLTISVLQITYYMVTIKEDLEHNKAMEKEWEKYQSELNVDGGDVYLFDD